MNENRYQMTGSYNGINQIGDRTREWLKFVKQWKQDNPPLDNGCYLCGICGRWVAGDEVTLDHIQSRSSSPGLRLSVENIQPAHYSCNTWKGSRYLEPRVTKDVYSLLRELSDM